ncbi:MAG: hypothetical protein ACSHXF_13670 [Aquaticitalea sp.]
MEQDNNIVDNTLNIMSESIGTFDNTLGNVPIYKSGHDLGGWISRMIDAVVDGLPIADKKD